MEEPGYYNIDALGKKFDPPLSRRTIRYYVYRGLLQPPEGGGRGHYYTREHLDRLKKIVAWSRQGVPLTEMERLLKDEEPQALSVQPMGKESQPPKATEGSKAEPKEKDDQSLEVSEGYWVRLNIGHDVELSFREGALNQEDLH